MIVYLSFQVQAIDTGVWTRIDSILHINLITQEYKRINIDKITSDSSGGHIYIGPSLYVVSHPDGKILVHETSQQNNISDTPVFKYSNQFESIINMPTNHVNDHDITVHIPGAFAVSESQKTINGKIHHTRVIAFNDRSNDNHSVDFYRSTIILDSD